MKSLQDTIGIVAVRQIKRRIRQSRITPKTDKSNSNGQKGSTLVGSGRLLKSIKHSVQGNTILIGTNVEYAKIQNDGGTIRPKNKKWLTIPLTTIAKAKRATEFSDTFVKFYHDYKYGIIFQNQDSGDPIALYKLVKKVIIPKREFMFLDKKDQEIIADVALTWMSKNIEKRTRQ